MPIRQKQKPPVWVVFISGGADGIGFADLAKFADANRHTPVCLFAAVQTHVSCVFVPSDKNKNHPCGWFLFLVELMGLKPTTSTMRT